MKQIQLSFLVCYDCCRSKNCWGDNHRNFPEMNRPVLQLEFLPCSMSVRKQFLVKASVQWKRNWFWTGVWYVWGPARASVRAREAAFERKSQGWREKPFLSETRTGSVQFKRFFIVNPHIKKDIHSHCYNDQQAQLTIRPKDALKPHKYTSWETKEVARLPTPFLITLLKSRRAGTV